MPISKYRIAGLKVLVNTENAMLLTRGRQYLSDFDGDADITIDVPRERIEKDAEEKKQPFDICEYMYTGAVFYAHLLRFYGFMLHSSAIAYDGKAYLFSAPCGTGKSTHASLWREFLGEEKVIMINDDKPAVRLENDTFTVYGTPWSGKDDLSCNIAVPLGGIVFLKRAGKPYMTTVDTTEAIKNLLWQASRPLHPKAMDRLLQIIEKLIENVPIYELGCDISRESFELSFNTLTKKRENDGK